jgi:hypothetical protein
VRNRFLVFLNRPVLASIFFLCILATAQQTLDNESVIKLVKAGLGEELIITTINASPGNYDTSANGLIALKSAGVSDKVVSAIVLRANGSVPTGGATAAGGTAVGTGAAAAQTGLPAAVDSVGVYYQDASGNWQEANAEVVNFKTGGAVKHLASVGIIKEDMNGMVAGTRSRLELRLPAQFIFYVPEGRSPGEYQLLRLHINSDNREFRSVTGGVVHEKGGAQRDQVDFSPKKIAPRAYQITLGADLGRGEYGFLPPLDTVSEKSMASSGKMYTFSIAQ